MAESSIEWTEHTWNPVTGCLKISPGCKNCYAETMAMRLQAMGAPGYENGFELTLQPDRLDQPRRRKAPTMYFVNSMSDLFHADVPDAYIDRVLQVCRETPQHTYQILTKRADRLPHYFASRTVPQNAWLGVSVEDRRYGVPRIAQLRRVNANVRFLSVEPLLQDLGMLDLTGIHWVIVGGESGHRARPMRREWAEAVQRQAHAQGVPFFFKQWGMWGADGIRRNKKRNGRELAGRQWSEFPIAVVAALVAMAE
jgi:protein gp37